MSKLLSPKVLVPTIVVIVVLVVFSLIFPKVVLPEISIPAEHVLDLFGFPITNSLLASWLTMIVLIVGTWAITRKMKVIPGRWQSFLELIVEGFYGMVEDAAGPKWGRRFFPIVMTIFLFVVVSNWMGLTPLFGAWGVLEHNEHGQKVEWVNESQTIGILVPEEESQESGQDAHGQEIDQGHGERYALAPMFRAATTDMNVTLALAIVSVVLTQYFGVKSLGIGYFGKFIPVGSIVKPFTKKGLGCGGRIGALFQGGIDLFIGGVETISEIGKVVSFSFRLFGNIFAGEVLLGVMAFLIPYIVSLPFYGLEIFVGLVQALVFMMLTVAFFVVAISSHGDEH